MSKSKPDVLFVCVSNAGKSQMAGALMRQHAAGSVRVHTAGTNPGGKLNQESLQALAEVAAPVAGEHPKPLDEDLLSEVTLIVVLGREAVVPPMPGIEIRTWYTDEPAARGINGLERMRLIRDEIDLRVRTLLIELSGRS